MGEFNVYSYGSDLKIFEFEMWQIPCLGSHTMSVTMCSYKSYFIALGLFEWEDRTRFSSQGPTIIKFFFFCLFRAAPAAYGGSQARGLIGAVAAGLRQSHSNVGSKPSLQPASQLTATPDP